MRVALTTMGCKVNQFDTAALAELFRGRGYEVVPETEAADVFVINTCSVTREAVRKCRQAARRAHRERPGAAIVLTGCYAQTGEDEPSSLPGVALVVGPQDRGRLVDLVEEYLRSGRPGRVVRPIGEDQTYLDLPVPVFAEHTRAWLKIQDGCEQFCAYCQIPLARGPVRSLPLQRVREEAARLVGSGYRELVLTGIHLGAYGQDLPGHPGLVEVIGILSGLPGLDRLRLGSVEPNDVTPEIIAALAGLSSFCPHLHLPLQSGDDRTLARMRRPYRAADYEALLAELRRAIPRLAVSTDLMAGFPGETGEEFANSLAFVSGLGLSRLHVFPFSSRPRTAAAVLPGQLSRAERQARSKIALETGERLAAAYHRSLLGRELSVLVEEYGDGMAKGLAGEYVMVEFPAAQDLRNLIVTVKADAAAESGLSGEMIGGDSEDLRQEDRGVRENQSRTRRCFGT